MTKDNIIIPVAAFPNDTTEIELLHNKFVQDAYGNAEWREQNKGGMHLTACPAGCHVIMSQAAWSNGSFRCMGAHLKTSEFHALMDQLIEFQAELPIPYAPTTERGVDEILEQYKDWTGQ